MALYEAKAPTATKKHRRKKENVSTGHMFTPYRGFQKMEAHLPFNESVRSNGTLFIP